MINLTLTVRCVVIADTAPKLTVTQVPTQAARPRNLEGRLPGKTQIMNFSI